MSNFRVDVSFTVEASSPEMARAKLLNALSRTIGQDYMEAIHACVGIGPNGEDVPVDTTVALDDPRLIAGAYVEAEAITEGEAAFMEQARIAHEGAERFERVWREGSLHRERSTYGAVGPLDWSDWG